VNVDVVAPAILKGRNEAAPEPFAVSTARFAAAPESIFAVFTAPALIFAATTALSASSADAIDASII
jgi:hypothetical protein